MESQKKINLYRNRDFAGNFELSIQFIKQNFSPIAINLLYLIPVMLVAAYFMPNMFQTYYVMFGNLDNPVQMEALMNDIYQPTILISYFLLVIVMYVIVLYTISYMAVYVKTEDGIVKSSDVWNKVLKVAFPVFIASLLFTIAFTIGTMLCFVPGVIVGTYMGFYIYVYINEDLGIIDSFRRSVDLVKNNFWVSLGYFLVILVIIYVASIIFAIPLYAGMFGSMFQIDFFTNEIVYIATVMIAFVGYIFLYTIMYIALGVMYYSHYSKLEGSDVESEIDSIGKHIPPYNSNNI